MYVKRAFGTDSGGLISEGDPNSEVALRQGSTVQTSRYTQRNTTEFLYVSQSVYGCVNDEMRDLGLSSCQANSRHTVAQASKLTDGTQAILGRSTDSMRIAFLGMTTKVELQTGTAAARKVMLENVQLRFGE